MVLSLKTKYLTIIFDILGKSIQNQVDIDKKKFKRACMRKNQRQNKKLRSMGSISSRSRIGTQGVDRDVRENVRQRCTVQVD